MAQKAWHEIEGTSTFSDHDISLIDRWNALDESWNNFKFKFGDFMDYIGGNPLMFAKFKSTFGNIPNGVPVLDADGLIGIPQGRVKSVNGQERNSLGAITITAPSIKMADASTTVQEAIEARVRINQIVNNVESGGTQVPLSAEMGKDLEQRKVNYGDIINDLESGGTQVPLSAEMGKTLQDTKINFADIVNNLSGGGSQVPLSAEMGKQLDAKIAEAQRSTHARGTVMNALTAPDTPENYAIEDGFIITQAGSGYMEGDALLIPSSLIDAVFIVHTIDGSGGVNTVSISKRGMFPAQAEGELACHGGHGTGCAITVTSALAPNTTLADIIDPQPNDEAIVLKDETHSNEQYRWQMADYNGDTIYNWVAIAPDLGKRDFFIDQISADELKTDAVTTNKIADGAVTAGKIAESAFGIGAGYIAAGDDERIVGAVQGVALNGKHIEPDAGNIVKITLPNAAAPELEPNPSYLGEYADAAEIEAVLEPNDGDFADNAETETEWRYTAQANPHYRGLVADENGLSSIDNPAVDDFADNAETETEWLFDGTAWLDTGNASGTTAHSSGAWNDSGEPAGTSPRQIMGAGVDGLITAQGMAKIAEHNKRLIDVETALNEQVNDVEHAVSEHADKKNNPHEVTKAQVGLGNVENTSDANKPVSHAQAARFDALKYTDLKSEITIVDENFSLTNLFFYKKGGMFFLGGVLNIATGKSGSISSTTQPLIKIPYSFTRYTHTPGIYKTTSQNVMGPCMIFIRPNATGEVIIFTEKTVTLTVTSEIAFNLTWPEEICNRITNQA